MRTILASALAFGLAATTASAAPLELTDSDLDTVTGGALINLDINVPVTIQDVTVELQDINVNAIANLALVAPVLSEGGNNNITVRQRGRIRAKRR